MTDHEYAEKLAKRAILAAEIKRREKEKDDISAELSAHLAARGLTEDVHADTSGRLWKTHLIEATKTALVAELLLQAGVTIDQIKKGTRETPYTQLRVDEVK